MDPGTPALAGVTGIEVFAKGGDEGLHRGDGGNRRWRRGAETCRVMQHVQNRLSRT